MNAKRKQLKNLLELLTDVAELSKCDHRSVGTLIVRDGIVFAAGYCGPDNDICKRTGCRRAGSSCGEHAENCRGTHAEIRALKQLEHFNYAAHGDPLSRYPMDGKFDMYVSLRPCRECSIAIASAPIANVFYLSEYPDKSYEESMGILSRANIQVYQIEEDIHNGIVFSLKNK
jgi:deoxycytidylate deaminase